MTASRLFVSLIGLALSAGPFACLAESPARELQALDFELSDGKAFVRLADLPPQVTLVNFWRADCPPCLREMPLLASQARRDGLRVVAIALQRPAETLGAPAPVSAALQPPVISLHGPNEPRGLLARFGNRIGALPHTVLLDPQRRVCAQHTGEVSSHWLDDALRRCQSPSSTVHTS